ncbi:MAG: IPT/TIG domain-containing protein [Bacteroidales bacterium]|nr:IPT/TIG domain-containing protein [Bacteroidales bacterium]
MICHTYYSSVLYNLVQEDVLTGSTMKIGKGMIYNLDPQFVNSNNNDYHLKAISPCIDAGDPASPYNLEPSDNGGRINMGAYGNTDEAAVSESFPRISFLSPRKGRIFGKDTLIIAGSRFLDARGNGKVILGDTESPQYLLWKKDTIICITPAHLPDAVDITIVTNDGKTGYAENCFSFVPPLMTRYDPLFSFTS